MFASSKQDVARGRPAAMTDIFVSYRQGDGGSRIERLLGALKQAFGPGHMICDVDDGIPAADVAEAIDHHLHSVDIVLVVIGPGWLAADGNGQCALEAPGDRVAAEIRAALGAGKPVWPLLLGGAALPTVEQLPAAIGGLVRRPAVTLGDATWAEDVERLIAALRPRQLPTTVRRSGLWEVTATVGVLVASLLIGDAWIAREVGQRTATAAAVPAAGHFGARWTAVGTYPQGAAPEPAFALPLPTAALGGPAGDYLARPGSFGESAAVSDATVVLASRGQVASGGSRKATAQRQGDRHEGDGGYLVLETTESGDLGPPLSFVGWKNEP